MNTYTHWSKGIYENYLKVSSSQSSNSHLQITLTSGSKHHRYNAIIYEWTETFHEDLMPFLGVSIDLKMYFKEYILNMIKSRSQNDMIKLKYILQSAIIQRKFPGEPLKYMYNRSSLQLTPIQTQTLFSGPKYSNYSDKHSQI